MNLKVFDLPTGTWSTLKTYGKPPVFVPLLLNNAICFFTMSYLFPRIKFQA
ncbi:acyl-CoA-binding domain-containing protein 4 [Sarracenia purpurea var. burkii]